MVLMFSVLGFQLAAPAAYALARALPNLVSQKRLETLVDRSIHGNANAHIQSAHVQRIVN